MKGWNIFAEALRLIVDNLGPALRVTLGPFLIAVIGVMALTAVGSAFLPAAADIGGMSAGGLTLLSLAAGGTVLICGLWAAVAWHRVLLRDEYPAGLLPPFAGRRLLSYSGASILVMSAVLVPSLILVLLFGPALRAVSPETGLFVSAFGLLLASFLFYRLCLVLPARAVGVPLDWSESWKITGTANGAILQVAVITAAASFLLQLPSRYSDNPGSVLNVTYATVTDWILFMIGVSLMSVLYRHLIEGKPVGA